MAKKVILDGEYFDDYLKVIDKLKRRADKDSSPFHLLLGNGFSIAYDKEIFSYNALFKEMERGKNPDLVKLFKVTNTSNFEIVMQQLDTLIKLGESFGANDDFLEELRKIRTQLKLELINTIDRLHPECVFDIPEGSIQKCGDFLKPYSSKPNSIISTNYDLLLYWVLMRYNGLSSIANDGFSYPYEERMNEDDFIRSNDTLVWGGMTDEQTVFYLHGALHLFDDNSDIIKEKYRDGQYIKQEIEKKINNNQYPIFVTEGDGDQKLQHIMHNGYLSNCYTHLKQIKGSLITLGFSFGESDRHILKALNEAARGDVRNRLNSVYVGVFSAEDKERIEKIRGQCFFKVNTFDARTVPLWK